jgi:hypothetical protein
MPIITEAEIKDVYKTAPQHLKELVDSDEVYNAFHGIRETYNLHLDHAQNLAMAIDAVILEMRPFEQLGDLLSDGLRSVDENTRNKILADINTKVFIPLRDRAKKQAEEKAADTAAKAQAEAPKPRIQGLEIKLKSIPDVQMPVRQAPSITGTIALQPVPPTPPVAAPAVPTQSVIEQKMSAPTVSVDGVIAQPTVQPPTQPKYHGSDPYREAAE